MSGQPGSPHTSVNIEPPVNVGVSMSRVSFFPAIVLIERMYVEVAHVIALRGARQHARGEARVPPACTPGTDPVPGLYLSRANKHCLKHCCAALDFPT